MLDASEIDKILYTVLPENVWEHYRDREIAKSLTRYLSLLVTWNRVINLTSLRTSEDIVRRHLAESLCCATALPRCDSVLDLGSGAGFPGIPIQLMLPEMRVTLAESHAKKAAFLREVVRELALPTRVFVGRAQALPQRGFACVCLRAVDPMAQALEAASVLAAECVCIVGSTPMRQTYGVGLGGWVLGESGPCLGEGGSQIYLFRRHG